MHVTIDDVRPSSTAGPTAAWTTGSADLFYSQRRRRRRMAPTVRTWHRPPALRAETPESRVLQRFQRVLAQTPLSPRTQGGPGTSASASSSLPEKLQALPENVAAIQSADAEAQLTGVTWFRKQL